MLWSAKPADSSPHESGPLFRGGAARQAGFPRTRDTTRPVRKTPHTGCVRDRHEPDHRIGCSAPLVPLVICRPPYIVPGRGRAVGRSQHGRRLHASLRVAGGLSDPRELDWYTRHRGGASDAVPVCSCPFSLVVGAQGPGCDTWSRSSLHDTDGQLRLRRGRLRCNGSATVGHAVACDDPYPPPHPPRTTLRRGGQQLGDGRSTTVSPAHGYRQRRRRVRGLRVEARLPAPSASSVTRRILDDDDTWSILVS